MFRISVSEIRDIGFRKPGNLIFQERPLKPFKEPLESGCPVVRITNFVIRLQK